MQQTIVPDIVKNLPLFSGVSEQDKTTLTKAGKVRQCARGQMLFSHGDPVAHFYIIISGTFQLYRTNSDGQQKTIDVLKAGQTMCESEILDSCAHYRVNAVPVEDSAVLEFPASWLKNTAREYSSFALNLLSLISQQAHLAEVEAEQQATMSAAQLVACFLQRLCILYHFNPENFTLPYSKTLIASRLGIELETFSRTLATLKQHGIVVEGTKVSIRDLERTREYVCSVCSIADECPTHSLLEKKKNSSSA